MFPSRAAAVVTVLLIAVAAGVTPVYDETAWTRQSYSFKLPFPAQLVISASASGKGHSLSSQTGPYDTTQYSTDTEGEGLLSR